MPPRKTRSTGATAKQPTLSFTSRSKPGANTTTNRISKPGSNTNTSNNKGKEKKLAAAAASATNQQSPPTTVVIPTPEDDIPEASVELPEREKDETEIALDEIMAKARSMPRTKITSYWAAKEKARKAPRVHQADLSLEEKVLREFDMSGQYGPSVGLTRTNRWKRAFALGLEPPVEVLSVLVKEEQQNQEKKGAASQVKSKAVKRHTFNPERSIVEELMASRVGTGVEV